MSKKSSFRGSFQKEHGKRANTLLKSESQHLYHIDRSLLRKLSRKNSLLLTCKTLWVLGKTLATDDKYFAHHRDNLTIPIRMQVYQKKKISEFFPALFKSRLNFEHFDNKDDPHGFCISEITDCENLYR